MQSRYSYDEAGWNWSSFKGFGTKTWPSDSRRNIDSVSNCSNTLLDQSLASVQSAGPRDAFSGRIRSFTGWTIKLNNDNELVVEGTLECGTLARSKPITERVTATKILSKFKHAYHLIGDITDKENELPGLIRSRFNEGFPQDWEKLVAIWKGGASFGSFNSTSRFSSLLDDCAAEKRLRLDMPMEFESQDDRMSRTMSDVKRLSAWTPFVKLNGTGESCLAFQGTLLSSMGYFINKNHETDIICRRLSARIVETVNREFYELMGNMNNTKRNVPDELVMWCRNGCPKEVNLFCEKWRSLKGEDTDFYRALPNGKRIRKSGQDRDILIAQSHGKLTNFITNGRSNSVSPKRAVEEINNRKRPFVELNDIRISDAANVDNDTNSGKKFRVKRRCKKVQTICKTSSETSSGDRDMARNNEKPEIPQVRPISGEKNEPETSPSKRVPSISFVYYKICPPTENVLSDSV